MCAGAFKGILLQIDGCPRKPGLVCYRSWGSWRCEHRGPLVPYVLHATPPPPFLTSPGSGFQRKGEEWDAVAFRGILLQNRWVLQGPGLVVEVLLGGGPAASVLQRPC